MFSDMNKKLHLVKYQNRMHHNIFFKYIINKDFLIGQSLDIPPGVEIVKKSI